MDRTERRHAARLGGRSNHTRRARSGPLWRLNSCYPSGQWTRFGETASADFGVLSSPVQGGPQLSSGSMRAKALSEG